MRDYLQHDHTFHLAQWHAWHAQGGPVTMLAPGSNVALSVNHSSGLFVDSNGMGTDFGKVCISTFMVHCPAQYSMQETGG